MTITATASGTDGTHRPEGGTTPEVRGRLGTARTTGLLYLALALTGVLGFLVIRPRLYPSDPAATLAALTDHELLARVGIALELGVVVSQALVAVWFYRLFRSDDTFLAGALAAFGMVNATAILASAAAMATTLEVALDPVADPTGRVQLLTGISDNLWGVGALFFGLWLIPMGRLAARCGMPRPLSWVLVAGGVGYVLSAFVGYLAPGAELVSAVLVIPATVGEFWMIGYLLHGGVFRATTGAAAQAPFAMSTKRE